MKLTLTRSELRKLLFEKTGLNADEIVIVPDDVVRLLRVPIERLEYRGHEKIAAIKLLRELAAIHATPQQKESAWVMGLGAAKWAIENWETFLKKVEAYGSIPNEVGEH